MAHSSKIFVSTDAAVFRIKEDRLELLLIKRGAQPYIGQFALPGGHLEETESPEAGIRRELVEETGLINAHLEPFAFYGDIKRDPRYRNISLAFFGMTVGGDEIAPATDAKEVKWLPALALPKLAFDHDIIARDALGALRYVLNNSLKVQLLIGTRFTLSGLHRAYELIFNQSIDKRNFRRTIISQGLVVKSDKKRFRFVENKVLKRQII